MARGPVEVQAACDAALAVLADAFADSAVTGSLEEWAGAVGSLQRVVDVASAAQDAAIAQLAVIEPEAREDGTWGECHRALGHIALDAPAVVSGLLKVSAMWAERRVRTAVRIAADGPAGTDTETGLGGLHAAMAAGRLDGYRASVLAEELEEAPPEVAATIVAALEGHLESEDAGQLRRRCRRALARISPDLLRQRARRARANSGLRRWAEEPGVDRWEGTFPSEEAARAWAAIDALAQRYVAEAVCPTVERARAKALTDLVAGNATVSTVLTLTVPATVFPALAPKMPGLSTTTTTPVRGVPGDDFVETEGLRPGDPAAGQPHNRDDFVETEGLRPGGPAAGALRNGDDFVEMGGMRAGDPVLASRSWVSAMAQEPRTVVKVVPCHPVTGALLDGTVGLRPAGTAADRRQGVEGEDGAWPDPSGGADAGTVPSCGQAGTDQSSPPPAATARSDPAQVAAEPPSPRGGPRSRGLPPFGPGGAPGAGPRPELPVPRLRCCRRVLRPRPRPTVAGWPDVSREPDVPLPAPSPDQATAGVAGRAHRRRRGELDRPHRPGSSHGPR